MYVNHDVSISQNDFFYRNSSSKWCRNHIFLEKSHKIRKKFAQILINFDKFQLLTWSVLIFHLKLFLSVVFLNSRSAFISLQFYFWTQEFQNTSLSFLEFYGNDSMRTPLRKLICYSKMQEKSRTHVHTQRQIQKWWITLMLTSLRVANGHSVAVVVAHSNCHRTIFPVPEGNWLFLKPKKIYYIEKMSQAIENMDKNCGKFYFISISIILRVFNFEIQCFELIPLSHCDQLHANWFAAIFTLIAAMLVICVFQAQAKSIWCGVCFLRYESESICFSL